MKSFHLKYIQTRWMDGWIDRYFTSQLEESFLFLHLNCVGISFSLPPAHVVFPLGHNELMMMVVLACSDIY
jgi:hypothetical protein